MAEADYKPRFTVSSLTGEIAAALEPRFSRIFVDGEISGWRVYPSGHAYFTLKDSGAQVSAVMFKSAFDRCRVRDGLKDGAKVLVCGKVTVYGPRGNYQLVVTAAKLEGEGDLMQRYLELKAKLAAEGLFDAARKRKLPPMPRRIGIVTSEAGAVIHDMCTVLTRRFPNLEITLFPSLVQGAEAPRTLIAGLDYFNRTKPDLVIIARGGGSFEDLFCFNDEALVRAVAACQVPIISAVGHETDFTLCDFAADVRAGTPSIAAELAVPVKAELVAKLSTLNSQLSTALRSKGEWFAQRLDHLSDTLVSSLLQAQTLASSRLDRVKGRLAPSVTLAVTQATARLDKAKARLLPAVTLAATQSASRLDKAKARLLPAVTLAATQSASRLDKAKARLLPAVTLAATQSASRLDKAKARLEPAATLAFTRAEARFAQLRTKLDLLSPYGVLDRGYALVTAADGAIVREAAQVKKGAALDIRLASGHVGVKATADGSAA